MRRYQVEVGGRMHVVDVQETSASRFQVVIEGRALDVTLSSGEDVAETIISPEIVPARAGAVDADDEEAPSAAPFRPKAPDALPRMVPAAHPPLPARPERGSRGGLKAPMPGTITAVETRVGAQVKTGQVLIRLEAMKMVNAIKAPRDAEVSEIHVQAGQNVGYGHLLVSFKEA